MNKISPEKSPRQDRKMRRPVRELLTAICAVGVGVPVFAATQAALPIPWAIFSAAAAAGFTYLQLHPDGPHIGE